MLCPHCYAETPDDQEKCASCGRSVAGGAAHSYASSPAPSEPFGVYEGPGDSSQSIGIMEAILRPFKDQQALMKIIIGSVLLIIPIIGWLPVAGYMIEYARRIIKRDNPWTLPDWDNFMGMSVTGVIVSVGALIWATIAFAVCAGVTLPFWGAFAGLVKKLEGANDPGAVLAALATITIPILLIGCILFIFSLVVPLLQIFYARNSNFMDLFNVGGALKLVLFNVFDYLLVIVALIVVGLVESFATSIISMIPLVGLVLFIITPVLGFVNALINMSVFAEFFYKNHQAAEV